jgi:hypothetical protein
MATSVIGADGNVIQTPGTPTAATAPAAAVPGQTPATAAPAAKAAPAENKIQLPQVVNALTTSIANQGQILPITPTAADSSPSFKGLNTLLGDSKGGGDGSAASSVGDKAQKVTSAVQTAAKLAHIFASFL